MPRAIEEKTDIAVRSLPRAGDSFPGVRDSRAAEEIAARPDQPDRSEPTGLSSPGDLAFGPEAERQKSPVASDCRAHAISPLPWHWPNLGNAPMLTGVTDIEERFL